jgi:hypothetical protein
MTDQEAAREPRVVSPQASPTGSTSPEQATPPATPAQSTDQYRAPASPAQHQAQHRAQRTWFRKKPANLPLSVGVLFLVIMLATGGNDPAIFDRTTSPAESRAEILARDLPPTAAIGQSVRDGKLAFIVASMRQPGATIRDRLGATQTAQGMFVIVRVDVTNIGYEARTLTATDQFLVNDLGQRFATSAATTSLEGAERTFLEKINPGSKVNNAPLLFDVPPGTSIASIELHDSPSSIGVKVALR